MNITRWIPAIGASVLLHGAGLAALAVSITPDPTPDQPVPKSQFTVEAADVTRSRAAPQTPQGDALPQAATDAASVQAGTIARSRAEPATLNAAHLANAPAATRLRPSAAPATAVPVTLPDATLQATTKTTPARAASLPAQKVQASAPGQTAPAVTLRSDRQTALRVTAAVLAATPQTAPQLAALSSPAPLDASPAAGPPLPETAPQTTRASATATPGAQAPALALPSTAGTATLAWSGAQDTAVSAASLAAIAAFTQEGDVQAASARVRDGIAGILAAVPCARLQTTFLPESGALELRGHIPQDALRGPVLAALREQVGEAIPLSDQLLILPRPQCGALAGIAEIGLPQSTEQLTDPAVIGDDGFARTFAYSDGDRLSLDLTAPDYDAYVYVDYFAADGTVIHLQPNEIVPLEYAPATSELSVGRARADAAPSLELTVSAPYGQEIAAAFAASTPLYDGTRPLVEPAEPYLAFLKERVAAARAADPGFKGEWVYFFITTSAD